MSRSFMVSIMWYYLIKCYRFFMISLGKLFVYHCKLPINCSRLKERKILINMINRIGDAVINVPMIKRMEKDGLSVSVLCSPLNRFIFEKAGIDIEAECEENEPVHILNAWLLLKTIFEIKMAKRNQDFDIFLTPHRYSPQIRDYAKRCKKIIGCAFGPFSLLFDYSFPVNYKQNVHESLSNFFRIVDPLFQVEPKKDDLDFLVEQTVKVSAFIPKIPFILFHIGGKDSRRINEQRIEEFIDSVDIPLLLVDDPGQPFLKKLQIRNKKIISVMETFSLFELLAISKCPNCVLYIGHEGGQSHILHRPSNCLILYTSAVDHVVYRPFTGATWVKTMVGDVNLEKSEIDGQFKFIAYKDSFYSPTFDIIIDRESYDIDLKSVFAVVRKELQI